MKTPATIVFALSAVSIATLAIATLAQPASAQRTDRTKPGGVENLPGQGPAERSLPRPGVPMTAPPPAAGAVKPAMPPSPTGAAPAARPGPSKQDPKAGQN